MRFDRLQFRHGTGRCAALVWLGLLGLVTAAGAADERVRFEAQPGGKVRLEGSSTIHDWHVESLIVSGFIEVDAKFPAANAAAKAEVTIPVRSLKSSGKKPMDTIMYETMKLTQHPQIEYRLLELASKGAPTGKTAQFIAKGALTVAGVTRTNVISVTVESTDGTRLKVTGNTMLKMTDFGMKPPAPTVGLGLIKTDDEVKVNFEWHAARPAATAAKP